MEMLTEEVASVRWNAAWALGGIGPAAQPAVGALIGALQDSSDLVRGFTVRALGEIGPAASSAVPALIVAMNWADSLLHAIEALGRIGRAARVAIPALRAKLRDRAADVRRAVRLALARIDPG
jgi:HEAT repeat protein